MTAASLSFHLVYGLFPNAADVLLSYKQPQTVSNWCLRFTDTHSKTGALRLHIRAKEHRWVALGRSWKIRLVQARRSCDFETSEHSQVESEFFNNYGGFR